MVFDYLTIYLLIWSWIWLFDYLSPDLKLAFDYLTIYLLIQSCVWLFDYSSCNLKLAFDYLTICLSWLKLGFDYSLSTWSWVFNTCQNGFWRIIVNCQIAEVLVWPVVHIFCIAQCAKSPVEQMVQLQGKAQPSFKRFCRSNVEENLQWPMFPISKIKCPTSNGQGSMSNIKCPMSQISNIQCPMANFPCQMSNVCNQSNTENIYGPALHHSIAHRHLNAS